MSDSSRRKWNLSAESLREIGILVMVFGPLDGALRQPPASAPVVASIFLAGAALIVIGIVSQEEG